MGTFTLDICNPFASGGTEGLGGPGVGTHANGAWYETAGNDLGAPDGTEVHAAFDGRVSKIDRWAIDHPSATVYGFGLFVRAAGAGLDPSSGDGIGCYYTHVTLGAGIAEGATITRGQVVGTVVSVPSTASHLHFAMGVRVREKYAGINVYNILLNTMNTSDVTTLKITSGGGGSQGSASSPDEHEPLVEQEN